MIQLALPGFEMPNEKILLGDAATSITELPLHYTIPIGGQVQRIRTHLVIPTQDHVWVQGVDHYVERTRMTNDDKELPFGIRFYGRHEVFLLDGHHRLLACIAKGRKTMRVNVVTHNATLWEARNNSVIYH